MTKRIERNGLRAWREAHGLTQSQAAKRFGVSQPCWGKIELGQTSPRRALAMRLIKGTGISADVLMRVAV